MKLLAAITAATVVSSMSMSAFGLSYNTVTKYEDSKVSVTTTVTLNENETDDEIAYLVYAGPTADSTSIKYIDQKNANSATSVPFTWTTTDLTINATAYVGTTDTAANAEQANVVKLPGFDVTYTSTGKGMVMLDSEVTDELEIAADASIDTRASLNDTAVAVFRVFPEPGYMFSGVTGENQVATVTDNGATVTVVFTAATTVTFNFVEATGEATLVAEGADEATAGVASKFAKITGAVKEVGILVAPDADTAAKIDTVTSIADAKEKGIYVMKAYQVGSTGIYAVTVEDNKIASGAVSAYAVDTAGNLIIAE